MVLWRKGWTKNVQRSLPAKIIHGSYGGHPTLSWGPILTPWRLKGSRWRNPRTPRIPRRIPTHPVAQWMHTNTPTPTQPRTDPQCAMPPCSRWRSVTEELTCIVAKQGYICHKFRTKTYSVFFPAPCRACCYQGLRAEQELLWDTEVPRAQRCYYSLIACSSKASRCLLEMDVKKCLRVIRGKMSLSNKDKEAVKKFFVKICY